MPSEMGAAKYDGMTPMVDEYTIERRDGKTVLRLVSSGIPNAPEWDGFYNGTDSGWRSFLRTLRHYLEHHGGRPRTTIKVVGKLSGSPRTPGRVSWLPSSRSAPSSWNKRPRFSK
jgi:hypothetical protein